VFRAANRFETSVSVQLAQVVLDMIVDGRAADMKLLSHGRCRCALSQELQNVALAF
jgi:hypothetical protein